MRNGARAAVVMVAVMLGCSGQEVKPFLAVDGGGGAGTQELVGPGADALSELLPDDVGPLPDLTPGTDADPETAPCQPNCGLKKCGDDGCGGSCGKCQGYDVCGTGGICQPPPCLSTKECPGELVCFKEKQICVECVGDSDCGEGFECTPAFKCVELIPCSSDKECKAYDMVCDKEAGKCVGCLAPGDCPDGWMCVGNVCFEPVCLPGEMSCLGKQALICDEMLTGWELLYECGDTEYCKDGSCFPQICKPDSKFCEEEIAITCNGDGSGVAKTEDCGLKKLFCSSGQCTSCAPDCENKECGDDGCGGSCGWCPDGLPCIAGPGSGLVCGTACDVAAAGQVSEGCEFWAADLDNVEQGQYTPVVLMVSVPASGPAATLKVSRFDSGLEQLVAAADLGVISGDPFAVTVPAGASVSLKLPAGLDLNGSERASKAIRLLSTTPVAVQQHNPGNPANTFTTDSSLLLPVHLLDKQYRVLSWPQRISGYTLRGNFAIVAVETGNTFIQLWPASAIKAGQKVNAMNANPPQPYEFGLKQGEVLALETDGPEGADLTGTRIVASARVALFGSHECANIPVGTNYCDHIEQQLLPETRWGKLHVADAFTPRSAAQKDVWRIVAAYNGTQVTVDPPQEGKLSAPFIMAAGEYIQFQTAASLFIESDKPVMVGHYLQGGSYAGFVPHPNCSNGSTGIGDPAFTLAQPTTRYRQSYRVVIPSGYLQNYLNVIVPPVSGTVVTIDGNPLAMAPIPVGNSGYQLFQAPVSEGIHEVVSNGAAVGVTVYGYACDVSYAHPGGFGAP